MCKLRWIMLLSVPGKVLNMILLNRMKDIIDPTSETSRLAFEKVAHARIRIATFRIITEQSLEWNASLDINFLD